ncbi:MAG: hypothetical protein DRJ05_20575, partial [Bacteroidetes bacterium]
MSIAQLVLAGNWLLEGKFRKKFNRLRYNLPALVLISFYLLHVIGLINSSDIDYALKDLRIKFPLLVLPLIMSTTEPPAKKNFHILLMLYIAAVVGGSFYSFGILITRDINDIREISPFISHIRFGLNVCMAIFISIYFIIKYYKEKAAAAWGFIAVATWLVVFLVISKSATGFYVLFVTGIFVSVLALFKLKRSHQKIVFTAIVILVPIIVFSYLISVVQNYYSFDPEE